MPAIGQGGGIVGFKLPDGRAFRRFHAQIQGIILAVVVQATHLPFFRQFQAGDVGTPDVEQDASAGSLKKTDIAVLMHGSHKPFRPQRLPLFPAVCLICGQRLLVAGKQHQPVRAGIQHTSGKRGHAAGGDAGLLDGQVGQGQAFRHRALRQIRAACGQHDDGIVHMGQGHDAVLDSQAVGCGEGIRDEGFRNQQFIASKGGIDAVVRLDETAGIVRDGVPGARLEDFGGDVLVMQGVRILPVGRLQLFHRNFDHQTELGRFQPGNRTVQTDVRHGQPLQIRQSKPRQCHAVAVQHVDDLRSGRGRAFILDDPTSQHLDVGVHIGCTALDAAVSYGSVVVLFLAFSFFYERSAGQHFHLRRVAVLNDPAQRVALTAISGRCGSDMVRRPGAPFRLL